MFIGLQKPSMVFIYLDTLDSSVWKGADPGLWKEGGGELSWTKQYIFERNILKFTPTRSTAYKFYKLGIIFT